MGIFCAPTFAKISVFSGVLYVTFTGVGSDYFCSWSTHFETTFFKPNDLFAELLNRTKAMTDYYDCATFTTKLLDFLTTFSLKRLIANCEDFINEQNFWFDVCGDREAKSDHHSGRIVLYSGVNKAFNSGKINDALKLLLSSFFR